MSENRHRAPRGKGLAAAAPTAVAGRHRAAPKPSRVPVAAGASAAAAAVAVAGFVVVVDGGGADVAVAASEASVLGEAGTFRAAAVGEPQIAGEIGGREVTRAARDRARDLLAERIEAIERKAAEVAQAKLLARQRACGYKPNIQRGFSPSATQRRHARTIIDVAQRLDLPPRAAVIALATVLQESYLRNINYGHLDSRGLFQQRPSAGWGSVSQVTNPEYSAGRFYKALQEVPGWRHLPLTMAAQRVQISAYPWAYARWERAAAQMVDRELTVEPEDLTCRPR